MSELTHGEGGLTVEQVASLTVHQMGPIMFRRRDRWGKLVRLASDVPQHVLDSTDSDGNRRVRKQTPLGEAYVRAKMTKFGMTKQQAVDLWNAYVEKTRAEREAAKAAKRGKKG